MMMNDNAAALILHQYLCMHYASLSFSCQDDIIPVFVTGVPVVGRLKKASIKKVMEKSECKDIKMNNLQLLNALKGFIQESCLGLD